MIRRPFVWQRGCAVLLAAWAVGLGGAAGAVDPSAWESRQTFDLGVTGPVRVTLPPEIRAAARRDAADLRLLAPDGSEVAFAHLNALEDAPPPAAPIAVTATTRLAGDTTVIEFTVPENVEFDEIRFRSPARGFLKGVTIRCEGPAGVSTTAGIVFRQSDRAEQLVLPVSPTRAARVRITVDDTRAKPVPITVDSVRPAPTGGWAPRLVTGEFQPRAESSAGRTRLLIPLGHRHRRISRIDLVREDAVYRRRIVLIERQLAGDHAIEQSIGEGWLHRSVFDTATADFSYARPSGLALDYVAPGPELEVWVDDGDSPPLAWTASLGFVPEFLAFQAHTPGRYTILAGNPAAKPPRYDVTAFRTQWLKTPLTELQPAPVARNPAYRAPETSLDVPELAGAFSPEGWRHRRPVTVREPGAQALELDLEVLAHAKPSLADLRLVRDARQVPYLLERSSRERASPVGFIAAPDPKRPTVGRWKLTLPIAKAPFRSIRLATDEKLFDRRVTLYEVASDVPGDRGRRVFGTWTWIRRGVEEPGSITLPLDALPGSRELFLEIEHGDNAPFAPTRIEITHPVVRLRFRASQPGDLALYFGNAEARAPSYDLQLVARELLDAPEIQIRSDYILDVEGQPVDGGAVGGRVPVSKLVFWGALAFVVIVLLVVVAKLLPKPPEPK